MRQPALCYVVKFLFDEEPVRIVLNDEDTAIALADFLKSYGRSPVTVEELLQQNRPHLSTLEESRARGVMNFYMAHLKR